jgi:hypothetical protein
MDKFCEPMTDGAKWNWCSEEDQLLAESSSESTIQSKRPKAIEYESCTEDGCDRWWQKGDCVTHFESPISPYGYQVWAGNSCAVRRRKDKS